MKTLFVFALAGMLGGCSSTTVINVIGGDGGVAEDDDAGARPSPAEDGGAIGIGVARDASTDAPSDVGTEACPIGVTRCFEYRQERCVDPDRGWTDLKTQDCCKDESRFTIDGTGAWKDSKSGLTWRTNRSYTPCRDGFREATLREVQTLLIGVGSCVPALDSRIDAMLRACVGNTNECLDLTTGELEETGAGQRTFFCVK